MDSVDAELRSEIMSRVGQRDTQPELLLRSALHKAGLRYRLYDKSLPGSPDLTFRRFRCVVFVHGCFWHSHGCYRSTVPKSRREFWKAKFHANKSRDERVMALLQEQGWRVLVVWECALVGKYAWTPERVAKRIRVWLSGTGKREEISGLSAKS